MYAPAARKIQGGEVRWGNTQNTEREKRNTKGAERRERKKSRKIQKKTSSLACKLKIHRGEGRVTFISTLEEKAFKVMRERGKREIDGWKMLKQASLNCPTLNYHHRLWIPFDLHASRIRHRHHSSLYPLQGRRESQGLRCYFTFSKRLFIHFCINTMPELAWQTHQSDPLDSFGTVKEA